MYAKVHENGGKWKEREGSIYLEPIGRLFKQRMSTDLCFFWILILEQGNYEFYFSIPEKGWEAVN